MATMKAEGGITDDGMEGDNPLHMAAEDLKDALKSGDTAEIAAALRAAFQILESEPQEEMGAE